ncbi:MAG: hypothetical protein GC162_13865 [Planctomycetes bacterium]|nr:hypothetical protein [Planctomycetota bacterium]
MNDPAPQPALDALQKWFTTVIMHPDGVDGGIASERAQQIIRMKRDELEKVIARSGQLTAAERIGIYANAYYARLMEVIRASFPVMVRTVGEELFDEFAFGYLQTHPSRSYTLEHLTDHFADYLNDTRPTTREDGSPMREVDWPDFLVDLAKLEQVIGRVFDGPGVEKIVMLTIDDLAAIDPADWPGAKVDTAPCLHLAKYRYPVNAFFSQVKAAGEGDELDLPAPADEYVALTRRDYIVRRLPLTHTQYVLLDALRRGACVQAAIEAAGAVSELDDERLARELRAWFMQWASEQLFVSVQTASRRG